MEHRGMEPPVNGPYVPFHAFDGFAWGRVPARPDRLNQGPFGVDQDDGWHTLMVTTPHRGQVRNFGMGLVGYAWEENGAPPVPGLTLEQSVSRLARLPFCDKLYIRCDWRDVQSRKGRLDLHPVLPLARSLARELGLGVGLRVQLSSPNIHPAVSLPPFLAEQVRFVDLGAVSMDGRDMRWREPDYTDPKFQAGFRELVELLAAELDGDPLVEWVDLCQYGYWGEGHTGGLAATGIADYATLMETFLAMTRLQLDAWKRTPLAVNTQPDISRAGNDAVLDLALRAGAWLRTDSIATIEESQQVEIISNRPPQAALIVEDGAFRHYRPEEIQAGMDRGISEREFAALLALDAGASYWGLWQMADNLAAFNERFPRCFQTMESRIGWRVRPAWIWRRRRYGRIELIVALKNDGVAGVPGALKLRLRDRRGALIAGGSLDEGHPHAGSVRQASFLLPPGVDYEGLTLGAEIETMGVTRPVRWAVEQPVEPDGSISIAPNSFASLQWRKDV
jgi:hypothetical protein